MAIGTSWSDRHFATRHLALLVRIPRAYPLVLCSSPKWKCLKENAPTRSCFRIESRQKVARTYRSFLEYPRPHCCTIWAYSVDYSQATDEFGESECDLSLTFPTSPAPRSRIFAVRSKLRRSNSFFFSSSQRRETLRSMFPSSSSGRQKCFDLQTPILYGKSDGYFRRLLQKQRR